MKMFVANRPFLFLFKLFSLVYTNWVTLFVLNMLVEAKEVLHSTSVLFAIRLSESLTRVNTVKLQEGH